MLHILNFYKAVCQLHLKKLENNTDKQQKNRINVPLHNKREKRGYHRRQGSEQASSWSPELSGMLGTRQATRLPGCASAVAWTSRSWGVVRLGPPIPLQAQRAHLTSEDSLSTSDSSSRSSELPSSSEKALLTLGCSMSCVILFLAAMLRRSSSLRLLSGCCSRYASTRLLRMWFLQMRSTGQRQVGHRAERSIQPE